MVIQPQQTTNSLPGKTKRELVCSIFGHFIHFHFFVIGFSTELSCCTDITWQEMPLCLLTLSPLSKCLQQAIFRYKGRAAILLARSMAAYESLPSLTPIVTTVKWLSLAAHLTSSAGLNTKQLSDNGRNRAVLVHVRARPRLLNGLSKSPSAYLPKPDQAIYKET